MSADTHEELRRLGIGRKIKALREARGLSEQDLATRVKVTPILISQIESDIVPPTLATLINIAKELDVGVDYFFVTETSLEKMELTRAHERLSVSKSRESDPARMTYNYQAMAYRLSGKRMEPFIVEFDSRVEEEAVPLSHKGEEFCYCLEGEIEFITKERTILLQPGDSLYFYSDVPHVLRGKGPGNPRGIFVLLPEK